MLLIMGCNAAQGYGISRPIPAVDVSIWLEQYTPNQQWLDCASSVQTPKEKKIKLLRLATQHKYKHFETLLHTSDPSHETLPFSTDQLGLYDIWIKRERNDLLFEKCWLDQLELAHHSTHLLARNMLDKHQQGDVDAVREQFKALQSAFDDMSSLLDEANVNVV